MELLSICVFDHAKSTKLLPARRVVLSNGTIRSSSTSVARVVGDARRMVGACPCTQGCPACIGPILGSDETREHSPKELALAVLNLLSDEAVVSS